MHVWEAQKVRLDLWDETDSGTVPRPILTELFDNEAAALRAVLDWSEGMTKNEPTFTLGPIKGWKVREGKVLWGYAVHKREVRAEHAAKSERRARPKGESTPQVLEEKDESVNPDRGDGGGSEG